MRSHENRGKGNNARCGQSAKDGRDSFAPNVGTRIFSVSSGTQLTDEGAQGGEKSDGSITDKNYTYTVNVCKKLVSGTYSLGNGVSLVTATTASAHGLSAGQQILINYTSGSLVGEDKFVNIIAVPSSTTFTFSNSDVNSSGSTYTGNLNISEASQTGRNDLFFRIATTGQAVPFGTSSNNVIYQARYTTTFDLLHGGEGWQEGDFFHVFMMDAYYRVTIETISTSKVQGNLTGYSADIGVIRPQPTPFDTQTTITSESILGDIRNKLLETILTQVMDLLLIKLVQDYI